VGQFGYLDMMQKEIDAMGLPVEVRILGVNGMGLESGNATACDGRDIPWLQEVPLEPVWSDWAVTYRDVVILDERNVRVGVYNLTANNLGDPARYAELKAMLVGFAGGEAAPAGSAGGD